MDDPEKIPILLVEGQSENLFLLEAILQSPDYRLVGVSSGKEALNALQDEEFALILLGLHGVDRLETAKRIKQQGRLRHIPILFLASSILDPKETAKAYSAGAADILFRPVDPVLLRAKVSVFAALYAKGRERWQEQKARAADWAIDHARHCLETDEESAAWRETEKRWAAQHRITRILAESATLNDATPRILQTACEAFGWEMGALWLMYRRDESLRCVATWQLPSLEMSGFKEVCRQKTFSRNEGLPGRIWAGGEPAWIADVIEDPNFPREPVAAQEGLHAAFGIPIRRGPEILGVLEFFSHEVREPDRPLLQFMAGVGSQIGQFIERSLAERALRESDAQLQFSLESARARLWLWDIPEDRLSFISPSSEGTPAAEYLGSIIAVSGPGAS